MIVIICMTHAILEVVRSRKSSYDLEAISSALNLETVLLLLHVCRSSSCGKLQLMVVNDKLYY